MLGLNVTDSSKPKSHMANNYGHEFPLQQPSHKVELLTFTFGITVPY